MENGAALFENSIVSRFETRVDPAASSGHRCPPVEDSLRAGIEVRKV
jgi:hypothetical protein